MMIVKMRNRLVLLASLFLSVHGFVSPNNSVNRIWSGADHGQEISMMTSSFYLDSLSSLTQPSQPPTSDSGSDSINNNNNNNRKAVKKYSVDDTIGKRRQIRLAIAKVGMVSYIASLCVALPLTLFPAELLRMARIISTTQRENFSLRTGQFCARWALRLFPFAKMTVQSDLAEEEGEKEAEPSIWVCNHISSLDVFFLLAADKKMRGPNKRPIKIVYWKTLENNPVTKVLFRMCGFIPIAMAPNEPGEDNQYDRSSFKNFLKLAKQAFAEGFDIGILPEGQLNPDPEGGLLPVFSGAHTLARMSKRPIKFLALHGTHRLWHPLHGMQVVDDKVKVRVYPYNTRKFDTSDDFSDIFTRVVGHFGAKGEDLDNWRELLLLKEEEVDDNINIVGTA